MYAIRSYYAGCEGACLSIAASLPARPREHRAQALEVAAFPVHALAARAALEAAVERAHLLRQPGFDVAFRGLFERQVALSATAERSQLRAQAEGAHDLGELRLRFDRA